MEQVSEASVVVEEIDADEMSADVFDVRTHNGWITIENPTTGGHRTFQVRTETFGRGDRAEKKRVVSLLVGPNRDDWQDWQAFGFVGQHGVRVWRKFQGDDEKSAFEKYAALLEDIERGERSGLEYHLAGRCRCCNRPLTVPASIRAGIGPICAGRE